MDKLFIIMPAYNEEENIHNVIAQWHPVAERISPDSRLVVIDDGSRDRTLTIARNLKKHTRDSLFSPRKTRATARQFCMVTATPSQKAQTMCSRLIPTDRLFPQNFPYSGKTAENADCSSVPA